MSFNLESYPQGWPGTYWLGRATIPQVDSRCPHHCRSLALEIEKDILVLQKQKYLPETLTVREIRMERISQLQCRVASLMAVWAHHRAVTFLRK